MRLAQRGGSVNPQAEQQVEVYDGVSVHEVAGKIATVVDQYAVRIVSMTAYADSRGHRAIVVFEEER